MSIVTGLIRFIQHILLLELTRCGSCHCLISSHLSLDFRGRGAVTVRVTKSVHFSWSNTQKITFYLLLILCSIQTILLHRYQIVLDVSLQIIQLVYSYITSTWYIQACSNMFLMFLLERTLQINFYSILFVHSNMLKPKFILFLP